MGNHGRHPRQGADVQAPAATTLVPEPPLPAPSTPAAVLALQRSAGNQAVQRALHTGRLLQRRGPQADPKAAPAGPSLPPGKNFLWQRRGMDFVVVVSKQFLLDRKVSPDAVDIDIAIVNELLTTVNEVAPWVDLPALQKGVRALRLDSKLSELPAAIPIRVSEQLAGLIGAPPGDDVVVQPARGGATVYVDAGLVRPLVPNPTAKTITDSAFSGRLFAKLEEKLNQTMGADREAGFRATLYRDWEWQLPFPPDQFGRSVPFHLDADDLETLFGEGWAERANKSQATEAGRVKGGAVAIPASLKDDWPQIMAVLKELLGPPDPTKKKDEKQISLSEKDALMLLKIAKSPLRNEIIARLKGGGDGSDKRSSLGDTLESVIEEQELKDARKRLGLGDPGTGGEDPVVKRPVHGNIMLTGGRPVPGKEAVFTFEVTDEVDALRAPLIQIQWVVYPQDNPKLIFDSELNTYSPLRADGLVNDKLFEVTFPKAGTYVVEALVNHNFFRTAHFKTEVKVLTEAQEVEFQEKGAMGGFAAPTGATTVKHDFGDVGAASSAMGYDIGTKTTGKLDAAFKAGTLADRLKVIDDELGRVEKLFKQYELKPGEQAKAVRNWAEDYLKSLKEARQKIEAEGKGAQMIPCTGVYVSRSKKAPSKALNLVCLQTRNEDGTFHVSLHDLSQVYENDNYHFEVDNKTAEGAYEEVFVEAAESYPDGTMSMAFQRWDPVKNAPTGDYVKFRKVTDTVGKDIKTNVFDPAVNIAVNIAAAVMMVVPGLQAAGFALAVIWNTSQTIAELEEKSAKGTLKDKDWGYAIASFAVDLLPVVGRSTRVISLGRKAFYVIEGVQLGLDVLLLSAQGMEMVDKVRNGVISKLAKINEKITELERVNPADPELESLRAEQENLIRQGEDAVLELGAQLVAQQAVMRVGGALIQTAAIKKLGARIGELEVKGRFAHRDGEPVRYDFAERKIVGDKNKMTEAQFDAVDRIGRLSERLEGAVPDPAIRQRVVESLGDGPVEIVTGGKTTQLKSDGDKKVLHVADGARPHEVLDAVGGHATQPKPPAGTTAPDPPKKPDPDDKKPAPDDPKKPTTPDATPPAYGLDAANTKKLIDAVGPDQARVLHEFLGEAKLREAVAKRKAAELQSWAEGIGNANAAASDPGAAKGLARLRSKQHERMGGAFGNDTVADVLSEVPAGRMELFLRVLGDPDMPHPRGIGAENLKTLAQSKDQLGFIHEYGAKTYDELRKSDAFDPLLKRLRDEELPLDEAHALVDAVRSARGDRAKLKALDIEPKPIHPRRTTGKVAANKNDPQWADYVKDAKIWADAHRGKKARNGKPYDPDDEQIEMLAAMNQIRENAGRNRGLPHDKRVQMLDEFDQLGRDAGLLTQWINNLRGNMSEVLFSPSAGRGKTRVKHPEGGYTILDYSFEPGTRPGTKSANREWVEQKSDLITAPGNTTEVFGPAVGRAKKYAADASLDMKALKDSPATANDTILIDFVRPTNDATQEAMLRVLFGSESPVQAVRFADGKWINRDDWLAAKKTP